ncbi:MFS transporter [Labrys monachus]|uniref:MFS family permease n=1 Tax=Labrys monachus TaxID=217067 RepID=A0ABU0FCR6_9HYPH|nr:MFS transporter [Labrys monachus]MDQ0392390.1 MFS family permease [Labrys monachus]
MATASGSIVASPADQALMDKAVKYLVSNYSPQSKRVGWLMLASILVEAWDLYSIAFVMIYLKEIFNPSPALLGFAAAGTQAGAVIGSLLGGWLSDRIGRRKVFLSTMLMFIVLALAQAFAPNMVWLAVIRLVLGIPLGSDISNGYTYIMEFLPKGEREVVGNRWQFMFALGQVVTLACIAVFIIINLPPDLIWRVTLGLGALPAAIIFLLRHNLPETAIWLIRHGRFREAKQVAAEMYHDGLDMLPDRDVVVEKPKSSAFLAHIFKDPIRRRATLFGWIACVAQGLEFSTFAFYIPVLLFMVGVSGALGTNLVTIALYLVAAVSGWVGPLITPKIGQRGLSIWGFSIVLVGLLVAAFALYTGHTIILPFAAAAVLWGHYWDAENCMTIPTMVARPEYRGTASGFAYIFVKLPSFLGIFLFPVLFGAIGQANATLVTAIFPLMGLLAAIFILPEVYGYEDD